jgi:hydroxymethylpyrimidine/phosphomethylpyrimidine kinase
MRSIPTALTIAGSDSGGGAGIQADLKTFATLGVHGTSVITCITAQNPKRVLAVEACSSKGMRSQLKAVFEELRPAAVKTGMLFSAHIIHAVADFLRHSKPLPLVIDPVMVSTSGTRLLQAAAMKILTTKLFPMATLLMPNLPETEVLLGTKVKSPEDMREAARALHERFGCAFLIKGGHLRGFREAADIFYDGHQELLLAAPFISDLRTHGTGCTYSAAVTAHLARGRSLSQAVMNAKKYITQAIADSRLAAGHPVLATPIS